MSKLEDLRNYVSNLFESATEKDIIEKAAVVSSKIDEIEADTKASQDDYNKLLKDYKEVVIHSSFKPSSQHDTGADCPNTFFDENKSFEEALKSVLDKK